MHLNFFVNFLFIIISCIWFLSTFDIDASSLWCSRSISIADQFPHIHRSYIRFVNLYSICFIKYFPFVYRLLVKEKWYFFTIRITDRCWRGRGGKIQTILGGRIQFFWSPCIIVLEYKMAACIFYTILNWPRHTSRWERKCRRSID